MSLQSSITLSVTLLALLLGAGTASGVYSYKMGYESLKGVNQPDVNPTKKLTGNKKTSDKPQEFTPVKEKDIIAKVETYIKNQTSKPDVEANKSTDKGKDNSKSEENNSKSPNKTNVTFPITSMDSNVTFTVVNATQEGGSLLLNVELKNQSDKDIQFLYTFLEVKDEQGNSLSAITEGLPEELPPNSETFSGTVRIPAAVVNQNQKISLSLTDYPDQKLQLSIANIPVTK